MNADPQITDTYAHQLLPQLCFVQTTEFFPNLWNADPDSYANLLWERIAALLEAEEFTPGIRGKKIDPGEGLTIFLVEFPQTEPGDASLRAAAAFVYRRSGVSFAIQQIGCFTQERSKEGVFCYQWEDSPSEYVCTHQQRLADEGEAGFVEAVEARMRPQVPVGEPIESEQPSEAEQLFEAWKDRIPEHVRAEILAYFSGARVRLGEICEEIAEAYPQVRGELEEIQEESEAAFFKIGVISFAVGSEKRELANIDVVEAVAVGDLPPVLGIPLHQASDGLGELIGRIYDALERGGLPFERDWPERLHGLFEIMGRAEIDCMVKGMVTFLEEG